MLHVPCWSVTSPPALAWFWLEIRRGQRNGKDFVSAPWFRPHCPVVFRPHKPRCVSEEVVFLQRLLYASRVFSLLVLGAPGRLELLGSGERNPLGPEQI